MHQATERAAAAVVASNAEMYNVTAAARRAADFVTAAYKTTDQTLVWEILIPVRFAQKVGWSSRK